MQHRDDPAELDRLPGIERNVPLAPLTTYRIGGPAERLLRITAAEQVAPALAAARSVTAPVTILGGGSNVVVSDAGIRGLVLLVAIPGTEPKGEHLRIGAGENFQRLVGWTAARGISGLEFGIGIYGTVGGAVAGNAGAFGSDLAHVTESVEAVDATGQARTYSAAECDYSYRRSRFPREGSVVTAVTVRVHPEDPRTVRERAAGYLAKKRAAQPLGALCAGCIFQNHHAVLPRDAALLERFARVARGTEIPAGAILAEAGLSGQRIGGIRVSEVHANFFVNDGSGTAEQVVILLSRVQQRVRDSFGVNLQPEVRLLGFNP